MTKIVDLKLCENVADKFSKMMQAFEKGVKIKNEGSDPVNANSIIDFSLGAMCGILVGAGVAETIGDAMMLTDGLIEVSKEGDGTDD